MDHIRMPEASPEFLREVDRMRQRVAASFQKWCRRRGFTIVVTPEFWLTKGAWWGWWRATVRLPDGVERRVYTSRDEPDQWRLGDRSKKKA